MCPTHQKTSWIRKVTVLVWVKNCLRKFTALVWLKIWLGKFLLNVGSSWFCLGEIARMVGRKSGSENPVQKRPSPTLGGSDSRPWLTKKNPPVTTFPSAYKSAATVNPSKLSRVLIISKCLQTLEKCSEMDHQIIEKHWWEQQTIGCFCPVPHLSVTSFPLHAKR